MPRPRDFRDHPWLRECSTIWINGIANRQWIRQALAMHDGTIYLVVSSNSKSALLECRDDGDSEDGVWSTRPMVAAGAAGEGSSDDNRQDAAGAYALHMAMGAAAHGKYLLVADYTMHRVVVFEGGVPVGVLAADSMRQPSTVATDGETVFVAGSGMVHEFDLKERACTRSWPTSTPEGGVFECDHGLAIHQGSLFMVDRRGSRVHVFSVRGDYVRSFGGPGEEAGRFRQPWGIAICQDHVLVSEHSGKRMQIFTLDGVPVGQLCPDPDGCGDLASVWADQQTGRVLIADWDKRCVRVMQLLSRINSAASPPKQA